ncbi:MAG: hypothetical protein ISS76_19945 [Phycisphaerae bacterium]|nr:hypothetical protein [Phycisphaerae bacterium]
MNIIDAIKDQNLFRPFLEDGKGKLSTWSNWMVALRFLYGLPITKSIQLIEQCTGRKKLSPNGFDTALFLTGRRSGKSRIAAVIGAFEAALSGREKLLAKGEIGMVAILAPTQKQGRIVKEYLRAIFDATPMLQNEVVRETQWGFELANGVRVEILVGDYRSIRGYTLLACIVDEICFFGLDAESKVKSDTELIRAIRPSLATIKGRLICISSPYAKKGWAYNQWKRYFGNDSGSVLVWNCPSRTMNPLLPQSVVDEAMAEDLQAAKSEYLGEFRDDVCIFLPREVVESVVVKNRFELLPRPQTFYYAFTDVSGGRNDDAGLGIAHKEDKVIIDFVKRYKPPHSPYDVIKSMCDELRRFGIRTVTGDNYSAEFVAQAFQSNGIIYNKSKLSKSELFLELLPRLCSGEIELLDNEILINQLSTLERRTRSGGRDIIDKPQGGHDDVANVVAGVSTIASKPTIRAGAIKARTTRRRFAFS